MLKLLAVLILTTTLPLASQASIKDWTLMVFINGHNNLDQYGESDINEMEKVGSSDDINIVVQRGTLKQNTTRLYVKKDTNSQVITSPVAMDMGKKVDMGDYKNLVDFIRWGSTHYPAKQYFVVVWNHGSGWHRKSLGTRGISYDDLYNSHISTVQFGLAMKEASQIIGHKINIVGSDACLMGMPEIASEMTEAVDLFVASEETEPVDGWPYDTFLEKWVANPRMTPQQVTAHLTEVYIQSYQNGTQGTNSNVTLSAFDLSMMSQLETGVAALSRNIRELPKSERDKVLAAAQKTFEFYYSDYRDLGDFLKVLHSQKVRGLRNEVLTAIQSILSKFVVANSVSPTYTRATGAAFWLPTDLGPFNAYKGQYQDLEFHKRTEWGMALESLFQ